jgi:8-oxo-dGTP pyrophosphatase MutT (NUDIX family)
MFTSIQRPVWIDQLHQKLVDGELPGHTAHEKMAHAVRRAEHWTNIPKSKEAGVLIVLFEKSPGDVHLIFIRRGVGHEQDKHAGQIAFPGGKKEQGDRDLMFTALREAEEEIAIDLTLLDVLGSLTPLYIPVSKYLVHPFVAYAYKQPELTKQESEIAEILELPLSHFRSATAKQTTKIRIAQDITLNHVPCFQIHNHIIWGATAMIMNELLEMMTFA